MAFYTLEPDGSTVHGSFDRDRPPVLTIDPGDTVRVRTLDAGWGLAPPTLDRAPRARLPRPEGMLPGHAMCGPIAVRGAQPGMALAVRIDSLQTGSWGWTYAGGWRLSVNQALGLAEGEEELLLWSLDPQAGVGSDQRGRRVRLRPFLGVMGVALPDPGQHDTRPPRRWGGNLDCRELVAGSTLYLPVGVPGALFSCGDGHAAQGDGEVCGQAIECPMEAAELTFDLREDMRLPGPAADTPAGWVTFGVAADLHDAAMEALDAMVDHIANLYGATRKEALALASVAVDLRVTQLVNLTLGVHAVLPPGAIS